MSGSRTSNRFMVGMAITEQDTLRLLMKARDRVSAAAWVIVRDAQVAEDIFQNVALKAMTRDVSFDTAGAVLSWAFITARREAIDWKRRNRLASPEIGSEILDLLESEWVKESTAANPAADALRECVETLPDRSREILRLRYFEGLPCQQVADRIETGLDAIYKRLSRLHQALKDCVERRVAGSQVTGS